MLRTRDFVLLFTAIVFLLVAIGGTVVSRWFSDAGPDGELVFVNPTVETYPATVPVATETTADRIAAMRQKIMARGELVQSPVSVTPPPVTEPVASTSEETPTLAVAAEQRCSYYRAYSGVWSAANITLRPVEGVRIAYESTVSATGVPTEVERLALPIRSFAAGQQNCVTSDVVGIAQDGSLIRNHEVGVYSVFGSDTVVGYALDGYPIYGAGAVATDACGGATLAFGYGYVLSPQRDTILTCFAAPPVALY